MFEHQGPVYLRTGRPKVPTVYTEAVEFEIGRANQLRNGDDVTIIACGLMVAAALEAAYDLAEQGVEARLLDMHTIKPLDAAAIEESARQTGALVTVEEHLLEGGLGAGVARLVSERHPVPIEFVGIRDRYAQSGQPQELLERHGLMPRHIVRAVNSVLKRKSQA
jgi:transketolase